MKILKACEKCTGGAYHVHLDSGDIQVHTHRDYEIFLDGVLMAGVCSQADEDEGWVEVLVQNDGSENGFAGPLLSKQDGPRLPNWHKPLTYRKLYGKVEIKKRETAAA